jgi:hypothetical protein
MKSPKELETNCDTKSSRAASAMGEKQFISLNVDERVFAIPQKRR